MKLEAIKSETGTGLVVRNIRGNNTKLKTQPGNGELNVFFETISADEFLPQKNGMPRITNLAARGKDLSFMDNKMQLAIDNFMIIDHQHSELHNIFFKKTNGPDSMFVAIPSVGIVPDLNSIVNGTFVTDKLSVLSPLIRLSSGKANATAINSESKIPTVVIGKISIQQPQVYLTQSEEKSFSKLEWKENLLKNNWIELSNFKISDGSVISVDKLDFSVNNFSFTSGKKTLTTGNGEIKARINNC